MANQGIIHFKETLNLLIPEFTTLGKNPVLTTNDNPLESSFMQGLSRSVGTAQEKIKTSPALTSVLAGDPELARKVGNLQISGTLDRDTIDVFRTLNAKIDEGKLTGLDAGTKTLITSMASIVNDFDSLDADSKEKIGTAQRLFRRTDAPVSNTQQAKAMMDLNRRYLGLEPSSSDPAKAIAGAHVDEKLALALREQMKELKKQHPDADFEPLKFDQKAVTFLKGLREKQMKDAGVDQGNLNQTLLNLWMMQNAGKSAVSSAQSELGKTSALLSAMEYISDGKLSGGTYTSRPTVENTWDKGWTNHQSPDHFFNPKVYVELLDNSQKNPGELKVSTLLSTTGNVRQNENLDKAIEKLRQDLKDPTKLDNAKQISSMIDQIDRYKRDPKAFDSTLTKEQVGILAIEILALQAKELCIDQKDVNQAIRSGKMAPHLADLSLVDDGLGKPATLKYNDRVGEELAYRSNKFAERFGTMSDEQSRYAADQLKRLNPTMNTNWINANHQSPTKTFSMFSIMSGQAADSPELAYNKIRERYLLDLNERLQKAACAADAKPAPTSTVTTQAPATTGVGSVPAGGAAAGTESAANVGCVANATGPCAPEKPPEPAKAEPVGCVAGASSGCKTDFAGASSDNAATATERVKSNIVDATGNAAEPLPEAHTLPQPQNRAPAAASGAP